ncbi:MAG: DHH family phosphoesterase [Candidatus Cyclobacteriaceae bacterium M3_2C_046]
MRNLQAFKELLGTPKKIVITTHFKPDADALGSSLGLAAFLKKKNHEVNVITPSDFPDFLNWMDGTDQVVIFEEKTEQKSYQLVKEADMIFCLDFNSLSRINGLGSSVHKSKAIKVLIDHHLDPDRFADFELWSTEAAATAELVYELINLLEERHLIDISIANCLYAGIMTDTGQFKHSNTTKNVHLVTADLIELGAETAKVGEFIYDNNSLNRLKFIGFALNERLVVLQQFNTAYFAISKEDLSHFKSKTGDTEGLVNYALSLKDVIFAAVIIDREDEVKISFRSKGNFSVNDVARVHFEGGGHKNAAGGRSDEPIDRVVERFVKLLPAYKENLNETNKKIKST